MMPLRDGIEVDLNPLRRDHGAAVWARRRSEFFHLDDHRGGAFLAAGPRVDAAALIGLCVALASSVVM